MYKDRRYDLVTMVGTCYNNQIQKTAIVDMILEIKREKSCFKRKGNNINNISKQHLYIYFLCVQTMTYTVNVI